MILLRLMFTIILYLSLIIISCPYLSQKQKKKNKKPNKQKIIRQNQNGIEYQPASENIFPRRHQDRQHNIVGWFAFV